MDVIMPQLGETVAEGVVTKWYKKVGDAVKADEALFDVETDKVSTEIPAQANGVVAEILVQAGTTVKVGARLAVIRESAAAAGGQPTAPLASRRNTFPGNASVCLAFSTTNSPLTMTVVRAPLGNWCGSA